MVLSQTGETVNGTLSRTASFVVSDTGTLTGTVMGNAFTYALVQVTNYGGPNPCAVITTVITGHFTVADTSMTGRTQSIIEGPPQCTGGRPGLVESTWTKQ